MRSKHYVLVVLRVEPVNIPSSKSNNCVRARQGTLRSPGENIHTYIDYAMNHKNKKYTVTRRWHVTISCQPDGRPPQPVRRWKSGRVHLADGSNVVVLELPYSTEFERERRKLASGVRKYGKFDDGR